MTFQKKRTPILFQATLLFVFLVFTPSYASDADDLRKLKKTIVKLIKISKKIDEKVTAVETRQDGIEGEINMLRSEVSLLKTQSTSTASKNNNNVGQNHIVITKQISTKETVLPEEKPAAAFSSDVLSQSKEEQEVYQNTQENSGTQTEVVAAKTISGSLIEDVEKILNNPESANSTSVAPDEKEFRKPEALQISTQPVVENTTEAIQHSTSSGFRTMVVVKKTEIYSEPLELDSFKTGRHVKAGEMIEIDSITTDGWYHINSLGWVNANSLKEAKE